MFLYKHINNTDIAFEIITQQRNMKDSNIEFTLIWWNVGKCHTPWCMNIVETLVMSEEKFKKEWVRLIVEKGKVINEEPV